MTPFEITLFILAVLIMLVGLTGVILPIIPGVPMIFVTALLFAWLTDFAYIGGRILLIFGAMTIAALALDWMAAAIGVKKMGGSYAGIIGAFIGMIAGLLLPGVGFAGFIIGAFIGAFALELLINRNTRKAFRAGFGSFIGFMAGGLMKFLIAAVMIGIFFREVLF